MRQANKQSSKTLSAAAQRGKWAGLLILGIKVIMLVIIILGVIAATMLLQNV